MSTEFTQTETQSSGDFTESEMSEEVSSPKKSSNKVIIVVALVAVVAVVGFYGMRIINSPSAPAPQAPAQLPPAEVVDAPQPAADAPPPAEDALEPSLEDQVVPQEVDPLAGLTDPTPAVEDPLAMDPSQVQEGEIYQPVDPLYQGEMDPSQDLTQPAPPEGVVVSPDQMVQAQPPVQDPVLAAPAQDPALQALMGAPQQQPAVVAAPEQVEAEPVAQEQVAEVVEVEPVAPAAPQPVEQDASFDVASLASVVGQAVSDALKPLEERWNARFDSLERRLSRVESRPAPAAAPARSTPAPRPASSARQSTPRASQASKRPANRIEVLDQPTPAPSPRPVVRQVEPISAAPAAAQASCSLGAVLEGRAWLKKGDGSFESYIVGDTLPDGKTITAITPEKGIVVNGQSWSCN